jgi:hypothetical protein
VTANELLNLKQPAHDWLQNSMQSTEISQVKRYQLQKYIAARRRCCAPVALHAPDLAHQRRLQHIQHRTVMHSGITAQHSTSSA